MRNSLTVFCEACGAQWKICDFPVDVSEMVLQIKKAQCSCKAGNLCLYIGTTNDIVEQHKEDNDGKDGKG